MDAKSVTYGSVIARRHFRDIRVTEARHSAGYSLPLHAHPQTCATLVLDGVFEERVDGKTLRCEPGDVVIKPADAAHTNVYGKRGSRSLVVEIPRRVKECLDDEAVFATEVMMFRDPSRSAFLYSIRHLCRDSNPDSAFIIEEMLLEFLSSAKDGRRDKSRMQSDRSRPVWLQNVYDCVYQEFRNRPSIAKLSGLVDIHPDYVCRAFRHSYGYTISDLVRRRRVEHALKGIRSRDQALACVAYEAGFSDQSHMSREVKRYLGVTPLEIRALH